eukprot:CAMPEP_0197559118 /NCGR_PEP_ID=MMETSP1320-20131121/20601_1 /TAXON_ID=91990 /ORGANISM="Bolidomonas sp., Strain RCC2347" /LENGTH=441 /DNA_ID=CAMNT_0043120511 /DNA_START=114 /DNA_END=1436 /DNA_ORIENTATION=+
MNRRYSLGALLFRITVILLVILCDKTCSLSSVLSLRKHTLDAILYRGTPRGLEALQDLSELSTFTRKTYNSCNDESSQAYIIKSLLPTSSVNSVLSKLKQLDLSTNPDSVDGLPSHHLNLIVDGRPKDEDGAAQELLPHLDTFLYKNLLSKAREVTGCPHLEINEVFCRRYGGRTERCGISEHYDITSRLTCVVALDDCAASGTQGLYTLPTGVYHTSERRFFPLSAGDAVLHAWDVLHGVNIEPEHERASLIVWFSEGTDAAPRDWMAERNDAVGLFVRGIAAEADQEEPPCLAPHPHDLYLKAAPDNAFAMNRLAVLLEEGAMNEERVERAREVVALLNEDIGTDDEIVLGGGEGETVRLARRIWLASALLGSASAQEALASSLLDESFNVIEDAAAAAELRLLGAVFCGLAAAQNHPDAIEAAKQLFRLVAQSSESES